MAYPKPRINNIAATQTRRIGRRAHHSRSSGPDTEYGGSITATSHIDARTNDIYVPGFSHRLIHVNITCYSGMGRPPVSTYSALLVTIEASAETKRGDIRIQSIRTSGESGSDAGRRTLHESMD